MPCQEAGQGKTQNKWSLSLFYGRCPYFLFSILKCAGIIYLDRPIEWVDEAKGICVCPHCGEKVKVNL